MNNTFTLRAVLKYTIARNAYILTHRQVAPDSYTCI